MTRKNQTSPKYFRLIRESVRPAKGVCLLVVRNERNGRLFKEVVPDKTYEQTKELGRNSIAFKFIPYKVVININGVGYHFTSFQSIPKSKWVCVGRCSITDDCQHLSEVCICAQGECL